MLTKCSKNASTVISDSSNLFTYACGFVGLISPYFVLEILECGNSGNVTVIEKCYSLNIISYEYCISCASYQLNSKEFYIETLEWSEDIWDFSELDVESESILN